jgi:hypothetical protein
VVRLKINKLFCALIKLTFRVLQENIEVYKMKTICACLLLLVASSFADDAEKRNEKRGVLGLGLPGVSPYGDLLHGPLGHSSLALSHGSVLSGGLLPHGQVISGGLLPSPLGVRYGSPLVSSLGVGHSIVGSPLVGPSLGHPGLVAHSSLGLVGSPLVGPSLVGPSLVGSPYGLGLGHPIGLGHSLGLRGPLVGHPGLGLAHGPLGLAHGPLALGHAPVTLGGW